MPQTAQNSRYADFLDYAQLQYMFLGEVPLLSIYSNTSAAVKKQANSPSMSDTTDYDTTPPCREPGEVEPGKVASREELYLLVAPKTGKYVFMDARVSVKIQKYGAVALKKIERWAPLCYLVRQTSSYIVQYHLPSFSSVRSLRDQIIWGRCSFY